MPNNKQDSINDDIEIKEVDPEEFKNMEKLFGELNENFDESDAFDNCKNLKEEALYKKKDYFIPQNENLTKEETEILAVENMPLVQWMVNKFGNQQIEHDELVSVALMGYTKAVKKFDPKRKNKSGKTVKFSTFAVTCIQNEILYFLRVENKTRKKTVSLNATLSTDKNGNELSLSSVLSNEDMGKPSLEEQVVNSDTIDVMKKVIKENLTPKESLIITSRFGIGTTIKTQNELAEMVHMSQANISKLEKNILNKIKKIMVTKYKIKNISI